MKRATLHIEGQRKAALEIGRERLALLLLVFSFAFIGLSFRLFQLTVIEANGSREDVALQVAAPHQVRADILDRNGVLLATSVPSVTLTVRPSKLIDPAGTAEKIAAILPDLSPSFVADRLSKRRRLAQIKQHLTPQQHYLLNAIGDPGLEFVRDYKRVYPNGALAAHAIGFTDGDGKGRMGVEGFLNEKLEALGEDQGALRLTIDSRVQHVMEDELWRAMTKHEAVGGAGVILDIYTGEILAMASLPDFDPNAVARAPVSYQNNRVTKDTYELGSIFKIFTLAGALDRNVIRMDDRFDATEPLKIAGFRIRDDHPQNRWLSTPEVLLHSSNIASGQIALKMGADNHRAFLQELGLLDNLSIELNEISSPRYAGRWGDVKTVTVSYGHGLAVSQLHAAQASAAILNGGTLIRATLMADDPISQDARSTRVISPDTSKVMRELLRLVVLDGTGSKADVPGYRVGGKTGTAEKPSAKGYRKDANMASFMGAFPMDDPRYVVLATLDEAKATKDTFGFAGAGWVAAPVVGNVVLRAAPILGVEPSERDVDITVDPLLLVASDRR